MATDKTYLIDSPSSGHRVPMQYALSRRGLAQDLSFWILRQVCHSLPPVVGGWVYRNDNGDSDRTNWRVGKVPVGGSSLRACPRR